MDTIHQLPPSAAQALLLDARQRDLVTARRAALLNILWQERYLTRQQLINRVEMILGKACFGKKAWKDAFYRDMRLVKTAFSKAGFQLKYSRDTQSAGYYLAGEPILHPNLIKSIAGALGELDPRQIEIYRHISPAQKFYQASSIIDLGKRVSAGVGK
ncbi:MAG: hypothetical protein ABFS17_02625 [Chloroflexota bacterium]